MHINQDPEQLDQILNRNGKKFLDDLQSVKEIVTSPEWSDYYITVDLLSFLLSARYCKVNYTILRSNSDRNGANYDRMLIKNF